MSNVIVFLLGSVLDAFPYLSALSPHINDTNSFLAFTIFLLKIRAGKAYLHRIAFAAMYYIVAPIRLIFLVLAAVFKQLTL